MLIESRIQMSGLIGRKDDDDDELGEQREGLLWRRGDSDAELIDRDFRKRRD